MSGAAASALTPQEFTELMQAAGPFPDRPHIAVGLSGGPDSMVLADLAQAWVVACRGTLTAFTVDHGLRPDSASEARMVAGWCADRNIAHEILVWQGDKPDKGIQAAARKARYGLLAQACRHRGCTALLVGHTENDQAETFLLRMSRGSGIDGLAAMPLVSFRDGLRLIRPLLTVSRTRVGATAAARSLAPATDPGNADRRYARVRLRQTVADLDAWGVSARTIAGAARIFGNLRAARETAIGTLAREIATVHPQGYAEIARDPLRAADPDIARGLVSVLILAVGGQDYPPRRERLDRLMGHMLGEKMFRPRTLGNCVIGLRRESIVIRREYRTIFDLSPAIAGAYVVWDGRFEIIFRQNAATENIGMEVRALGEAGWRDIVSAGNIEGFRGVPGPVRYALPAVWDGDRVVEVPHLDWHAKQIVENIVEIAQFRGHPVLSGRPFWVA